MQAGPLAFFKTRSTRGMGKIQGPLQIEDLARDHGELATIPWCLGRARSHDSHFCYPLPSIPHVLLMAVAVEPQREITSHSCFHQLSNHSNSRRSTWSLDVDNLALCWGSQRYVLSSERGTDSPPRPGRQSRDACPPACSDDPSVLKCLGSSFLFCAALGQTQMNEPLCSHPNSRVTRPRR